MTDTLLPPGALPITVRERWVSNRVTILDIEYDGAAPPAALFADLRGLGWDGAVPTSPRADVIDWGRPDPVRGTRYSVLSHPVVVSASIQGTAEACEEIRGRTRELLARHGFGAEGEVGDGEDGVAAGDGDAVEAEVADRGAGGVVAVLEVVCPMSTAAAVESTADDIGTVVGRTESTEVVESTFRGNVSRTVIPVYLLRIEVDEPRCDELVSVLSTVGIRRAQRVQ